MGQSQPCANKRDQLWQLKRWDGFVRNLHGVWGRLSRGDLRAKEKGRVTEESSFRFGQQN